MNSAQKLNELAYQAVVALLAQEPVTVVHAEGWERKGFPLPIKRTQPDQGVITQDYRPLAILEYVDEMLSGNIKPKKIKDVVEPNALDEP